METVPEEHLGSSSAFLFPFQGEEDFCWEKQATYQQENQAVAAAAKAIPKGPLLLGQQNLSLPATLKKPCGAVLFPWHALGLVHNTCVHAGSSCLAVPGFGQGLPRSLHNQSPQKGEGC